MVSNKCEGVWIKECNTVHQSLVLHTFFLHFHFNTIDQFTPTLDLFPPIFSLMFLMLFGWFISIYYYANIIFDLCLF